MSARVNSAAFEQWHCQNTSLHDCLYDSTAQFNRVVVAAPAIIPAARHCPQCHDSLSGRRFDTPRRPRLRGPRKVRLRRRLMSRNFYVCECAAICADVVDDNVLYRVAPPSPVVARVTRVGFIDEHCTPPIKKKHTDTYPVCLTKYVYCISFKQIQEFLIRTVGTPF